MKESVVAFCHEDIKLEDFITRKKTRNVKPLTIGINAGYIILSQQLIRAKNVGSILISENKSTLSNILKLHSRRIDCYINDKVSTLWEFSRVSKQSSKNFDNIYESMLVMSQTAHIGYTNSKHHHFSYKDDFVKSMDEALSTLFSSKGAQNIINRYLQKQEPAR